MPITSTNPTCLVDIAGGDVLDGARLATAIGARAAAFKACGAGLGSRIVFCHDAPVVMLIDLLSAWRIGATAVPLSASLIEIERWQMHDRLRPDLWIGTLDRPGTNLLAPRLDFDTDPTGGVACVPQPDDAALILMTSGTTGQPKGVVLTHRALRRRLDANIAHIGHDALARALVLLPLHFGHGLIGNALTPLAAGGTLVVGHPSGIDGLARLGAVIDRHQITFLTSVPSLWRLALRLSAPPTGRSLRRVHVGSERLPSELWRAIETWCGVDVYNMYGMTETSNWIGGISGAAADHLDGSVGAPWGGEIRVSDERGHAHVFGHGELMVQSPSVMSGYLDDDAATREVLDAGWLRTGDIGEIDRLGRARIVGRIKHQINRGGLKISAEEVDRLLEQHPDVAEACAFPVPDPVSGEAVGAAVVARPDARLDPLELLSWCSGRSRSEVTPQRLFVVDALARTLRGKLDRSAMRAQLTGGGAPLADNAR